MMDSIGRETSTGCCCYKYLVLLLEANQGPQIFGDNTRLTDAFLFDQPSLFFFVILPQLEESFGVFQPPTSSFRLLLDSVPEGEKK
jgi:hypothetical protein